MTVDWYAYTQDKLKQCSFQRQAGRDRECDMMPRLHLVQQRERGQTDRETEREREREREAEEGWWWWRGAGGRVQAGRSERRDADNSCAVTG